MHDDSLAQYIVEAVVGNARELRQGRALEFERRIVCPRLRQQPVRWIVADCGKAMRGEPRHIATAAAADIRRNTWLEETLDERMHIDGWRLRVPILRVRRGGRIVGGESFQVHARVIADSRSRPKQPSAFYRRVQRARGKVFSYSSALKPTSNFPPLSSTGRLIIDGCASMSAIAFFSLSPTLSL